MPQAYPAVAAFVKWLVSAKTFAAFVARIVVMTAVSYGLGKLLARRGNGMLTGTNPLDMRIDSLAPHRIIYGETAVGPVLRFRHAGGTNNKYAYMILVWAAHECEAITAFKADGVTVNFDGSGMATGQYAGVLRVSHHLGAYDQEADDNFVAEIGGIWTANHRLRGRCYSAVRLEYNQDKFPTGIPQFTATVKGRKVYDWRDGTQSPTDYATWKWSDNPALCTADFLRGVPMLDALGNLVRPYGIGCDESELPASRWIAEANACDEPVPLAAGGYEKRYTCNGCFDVDTMPPVVLDSLAGSMGGRVVPTGSEYIPFAGVWHAPDFTLDETMLRGEPSAQNPLPRTERINVVKGTFNNPTANYQRDDFPQIVSNTFIAEDGGELSRDLDLAFTSSVTMAQRIAKIALLRSRQGLVTQWPCNLRAIPAMGGENVAVDSGEFGWTGKAFEVTEFQLGLQKGDDGGMGFVPDLALQETDPSIFDWNTSEEQEYDPAPNTNSLDPRTVAMPTGLTLNAAGPSDRTALPRIRVAIDPSTDPFVLSGGVHQFAYKKNTDSQWIVWSTIPGDDTVDFISDLQVGATYNVRARRRNVYGVWSQWCGQASIVAPSGLTNYDATLTNEMHGVACDAEGNAGAGELGFGGRASTDVRAWAGNQALAAVAATPGDGQFAITAAVLSGTVTFTKTGNSTIRVDSLDSMSAVIRVTVLLEGVFSMDLDFTVVKVTSGGAYWLVSDAASVNKTVAGAYTPTTLNFTGYAKLLSGAPAPYAGRFIIATLDLAGNWGNSYTSPADETMKAFNVPASIKAVRCRLYQAGGTATLLDEEIIPITSDGATGAQGPQGPQGNQGIQGPAGANGLTTYFHIAYADSADGTVNFNQSGGTYVGTYVDTNPTDSTNPAAYVWRLFRGAQGPQGTQGIAGTDGDDGQTSYLHIKYSNDGTTFTGNGGEDVGDWLGWYVDFTPTDSASFSSYTWKKIKGDAGPAGPAGGTNKVETPVISFSPASNTSFSTTSNCSISCATSGAQIWVTYNGNTFPYAATFGVQQLKGVQAWAEKSDMVQSDSTWDMYETAF